MGPAVEFVLRHELFRSERTGEVIRQDFLVPHHPPRWHFDILRGLDCLAGAGVPPDPRMDAALEALLARRRPADPSNSSRWATLTALRVLERYPHREPRS